MSALPRIATDRFLDSTMLKTFAYFSVGLVVLKLIQVVYALGRPLFSPLRYLKGPENDGLMSGNMKRLFAPSGIEIFANWMAQYGKTFQFRGPLSSYRLFTTDLRAVNFIMTQTDFFPKPEEARHNLGALLGKGLLVAEGHTHKRQRRVMNPAFGPNQLRRLVPIFWERSNKLKDLWLNEIKTSRRDKVTIDVLAWLSRATLDIIGAAGFDHYFSALEGDESELAQALSKMLSMKTPRMPLPQIIARLKIVPNEHEKMMSKNMSIMQRIGQEMVKEKKAALSQELKTGSGAQNRDLLSLLIKANMGSQDDDSRMTDDEVLAQITTFFVAGHETTSTSTTWALYALAKYPEVQRRLRQELLEAELGDEPSMDSLDKLPYLDKVVRETLRLYPPVSGVPRKAAQRVRIPVSSPFKDRYGVTHEHISIAKGDTVFISIATMNRLKEVWGEDAAEFQPDRWDNLPELTRDMPGIWAHMMTFISGPRSCIGFRFALIEMKALLYSLIRAVEFEVNPKLKFESTVVGISRPRVASEPEKGTQMPLICKVLKLEDCYQEIPILMDYV